MEATRPPGHWRSTHRPDMMVAQDAILAYLGRLRVARQRHQYYVRSLLALALRRPGPPPALEHLAHLARHVIWRAVTYSRHPTRAVLQLYQRSVGAAELANSEAASMRG